MKRRLTAILTLAPLLMSPSHAAFEVELFHPSAVRIAPGIFQDSIDLGVDYVLAHDPDRLLAPFLTSAGLEAKAPKYGNWESTGLDGHSAGHFLSALSTLSLRSDDPRIVERLDYMLAELTRVQEANGNGYLGGVPNAAAFQEALLKGEIKAERFALNGAWVPWYNLHKTYAGLKDAWLIAERPQAKELLLKLVDWTETVTANLTDEQMQQMLYTEHGGMNEVFADLYQRLGDPRYLKLAQRFTHHEILDPLLEGEDQLTGFHANTQIPKVIGFQRTALATDDDSLQDASRFFWDTIVENRSVTIGGNSVREHFHPADDFSSMMQSREGPETCNTHNMMRLTSFLFEGKPSAELADYYERALYNHILSAQHPQTGGLVYFTSMRPRHYRVYSVAETAFWCCVGSGIENPGRYSDFIYAHDDDSLYVNLFIPSDIDWEAKGLTLAQRNQFPTTPETTLTVEKAPQKKLALKIRKPAWATEGFTVSVNGKPAHAQVSENGYATLTRKWKKGDTITVALPMEIQAEQLPDGSPFVSFLYGPLVLAARVESDALPGLFAGDGRMEHVAPGPYLPLDQAPMLVGETDSLSDRVTPISGQPLRFQLAGDIRPTPETPITLEPFNGLHESRYSVYWQVVSATDYAKIQAELEKQEAERIAIAQRTIDSVSPGEQQSEVEHDYAGVDAYSGAHLGQRFRSASKSFSYSLRAEVGEPLELAIRIFGSEWGKASVFKLNGTEIGKIELSSQYSDSFREQVFPVPADLVDSERVTVSVETIDNRHTPMVFEISLRRASDTE